PAVIGHPVAGRAVREPGGPPLLVEGVLRLDVAALVVVAGPAGVAGLVPGESALVVVEGLLDGVVPVVVGRFEAREPAPVPGGPAVGPPQLLAVPVAVLIKLPGDAVIAVLVPGRLPVDAEHGSGRAVAVLVPLHADAVEALGHQARLAVGAEDGGLA